jgi:sugar diacid utilization regulator
MQYEKKFSNVFREVIQGRGNEEEFRRLLSERYEIEGTFQVFYILVKRSMEEVLNLNNAMFKLENLFGLWKGNEKINASYGIIRMDESLVLILNNMQDKQSQELPDQILKSFSYFTNKHCFFLGIGPKITRVENLPVSYKRARTAMKMALGTGKEIINFDEMGFYKILFSVDDAEIVSSYADQILGPLEQYDRAHNTAYVDTLQSYIKYDRSLIKVAENTYTHRNTVNYRIQNIKRILGCELKDVNELFPYQVAFYIRDMEKKRQIHEDINES